VTAEGGWAAPDRATTRVSPVQVTSSRFGTVEVDHDRVMTVVGGLLGIPDSTRYVILEVDEDDSPYVWLQSVDEPEVAFLATTPWLFFPEYELVLDDDTLGALGLERPEDAEVFLLITVHREDDEVTDITANLLGPLVASTVTRRARQLVLEDSTYSTRVSLVA
jgi:flagellar assembly factor FliW